MTWITAKLKVKSAQLQRVGGKPNFLDMLLHPLKNFTLVLESDIGVTICLNFLAREEPVRPDSVVKRHNDNVQFRSSDEPRTIEVGVGIAIEAAALDEDIYRKLRRRCGSRGSIDIEEQAVLGRSVRQIRSARS